MGQFSVEKLVLPGQLSVEINNFSMESAALLRAYIDHVMLAAKKDFVSGSQTKGDLDKMFK